MTEKFTKRNSKLVGGGIRARLDDPREYADHLKDRAGDLDWIRARQKERAYRAQVKRALARGEVAEADEDADVAAGPPEEGLPGAPAPERQEREMTTTTKTRSPKVAATKPAVKQTPKPKAVKAPKVVEPKAPKPLPELPEPRVTALSVMHLFSMKKEELLANVQALSMAEWIDSDRLRSLSLYDVQDLVRIAIYDADRTLEVKATSGEPDDIRKPGDIDAYFGFTEIPKGWRHITVAGTNVPRLQVS